MAAHGDAVADGATAEGGTSRLQTNCWPTMPRRMCSPPCTARARRRPWRQVAFVQRRGYAEEADHRRQIGRGLRCACHGDGGTEHNVTRPNGVAACGSKRCEALFLRPDIGKCIKARPLFIAHRRAHAERDVGRRGFTVNGFDDQLRRVRLAGIASGWRARHRHGGMIRQRRRIKRPSRSATLMWLTARLTSAAPEI